MSKTMDAEVERLTEILRNLNPATDEYKATVESMKVLCEARSKEPYQRIKMDTILTIAANIAMVVLVLNYESCNVLTSKALSFIRR